MSKVLFRIYRVRYYKVLLEDDAKIKFAEALQRLQLENMRLHGLYTDKEYALEFGYQQNNVALRVAMYEYLNSLNKKIELQQAKVAEASAIVEEKRQEYVYAKQQREIYEKLKEVKLEAFYPEMLRKEQNLIDEIAGQKRTEEEIQ